MFWLGLILGGMLGGTIGVVAMAIFIVGARSDDNGNN